MEKIDNRLFVDFDDSMISFRFYMTKHYREPEPDALWSIAEWIRDNYDGSLFDLLEAIKSFPHLVVLAASGRFRLARIAPCHQLWEYLDDESQEAEMSGKSKNFLI